MRINFYSPQTKPAGSVEVYEIGTVDSKQITCDEGYKTADTQIQEVRE